MTWLLAAGVSRTIETGEALMRIPIIHMKAITQGARSLERSLRGVGGLEGGHVEAAMVKALSLVHPRFGPVTTIIVDSQTMDELYPPTVELWKTGASQEAETWLRKRIPPERNDELRGLFIEALLGLLTDQPWMTQRELEDRLDLAEGSVTALIRRLRGYRETVTLGCCFETRSRDHVLGRVLQAVDLSKLGQIAVAMDYERISQRATRLCRLPRSARKEYPGAPSIRLSSFAIPIWLHEQSHAARNAASGPLEEIHAQLDAYRSCVEIDRPVFKEMLLGSFKVPSCAEMMRRLARIQPPPYRVILLLEGYLGRRR
jgi:hypothetical protein